MGPRGRRSCGCWNRHRKQVPRGSTSGRAQTAVHGWQGSGTDRTGDRRTEQGWRGRSEEHTSELQSHVNLVCRLLLEKKKKIKDIRHNGYNREEDTLTHAEAYYGFRGGGE